LDKQKCKIRRSYQIPWANQVWQGQGVADFAEGPTGNIWLRHDGLLKPSRLIDAIRLRSNTTVATKAWLKKMNHQVDAACGRCKSTEETLAHILGQCQYTKPVRLRRHDEIKDLLRERLSKKGHEVLYEQEVVVNGARYKPDLVVNSNETGVLVLDVTVRYENKSFLSGAAAEKVEKYGPILRELKTTLGADRARVVPIIVGSRGALPRTTHGELKKLGISQKDCLTISLTALRCSIELLNTFIDR
ncbi:MAG: zinc-binding domain-containing protein, partial [Nitrososphaera sp.]|nr:zinc-binding domain-containing protein [Nitrososphaera sp.]